jgi:hypothetical protein
MKKVDLSISSVILVSISLLGLMACTSPQDLEAVTKATIISNDFSEQPASIQKDVLNLHSIDSVKEDLYGEGCVKAGDPTPFLKLHPKLLAGDTFVIQETKAERDKELRVNYTMSLPALPTGNGPIIYSGILEDSKAVGYDGSITESNNNNLMKRCEILDSDKSLEKCFDPDIQFSNDFMTWYNRNFKSDSDCTLQEIQGVTPKEMWSVAQKTLINGKQIKVYIHRTQTRMIRICNNSSKPQAVVLTKVTATSNDIVSSRYSHCGGEVVFDKTTVRDQKSTALLTQKSYTVDLAPIR